MASISIRFSRLRGLIYRHRILSVLFVGLIMFSAFSFVSAGPLDVLQSAASTTDTVLDDQLLDPSKWLPLLLVALGTIINALAWAVGKMIVLVLGMLIIPILGYNNFGDSNIINVGWPLVRDVVNMFVIIILLVIAIKTMLGLKDAKWGQQLPRLFLAIVAVNFSRTLTLLMIDVGQVIMFTFVNALRDIAAGNFVGLFEINSFMGMSEDAALQASAKGGLGAFGYLGSAYLTLGLLIAVLSVLVLMGLIFIYRIVILWILVILSPLAFFLGGIQDIVKQAGGKYGEWWSKLTGAIMLGPILTFFLWLALAAASNGSIAAAERFPTTTSADVESAGLYTEIFEVEKLTSLFVALVLIMVGFQAASGAAQSIGGIAGKYISEEGGKKLVGGAVGAPAALAYRGGKFAATQGARQAERRYGAGTTLGKGITQAGAALRNIPLVGGIAGGAVMKLGGRVETTAKGVTDAGVTAAQGRVKEMGGTEFMENAKALSRPDEIPMSRRDDMDQVAFKVATDKKTQKKLKEELGEEKGNKVIQNAINRMEAPGVKDRIVGDDEGRKKALDTAKQRHMQNLMPDPADRGTPKRQKAMQDIVDDSDFKRDNLSEAAVQDPDVIAALQKKVSRTIVDSKTGATTQVTQWDEVLNGNGVSSAVKEAALKGPKVPANTPANPTARQDHMTNAADVTLESNFRGERIDPSTLTAAEMNVGVAGVPPDPNKVAKAAIQSGADLTGFQTNPVAQAEFKTQATSLRNDAVTAGNVQEVKKIDKAVFAATGNAVEGFGADPAGNIPSNRRPAMREAISSNPQLIVNMAPQIAQGAMSGGNDSTQIVADTISVSDIEGLLAKHDSATSAADMAKFKTAASVVVNALNTEITRRATGGATPPKALVEKLKKAQLVHSSI